jgi:outer membrane lipoprotein-sorting protein
MKRTVITVILLFFPYLCFTQTAEEVAKKTETKLRSFNSLQADFEHRYYSSTVSTPLEEKGKLYLKKPGLMKWVYEDPEKKIFILKEGVFWDYNIEEKSVIEYNLSDAEEESVIVTLLTGEKDLLDNYSVEFNPFPTKNSKVHQIKLTPKKEEEEDSFILLEIDEKNYLIKKVILLDWAGNKSEFHFSRMKTNISLPKNTFELKAPPDVEIIKN